MALRIVRLLAMTFDIDYRTLRLLQSTINRGTPLFITIKKVALDSRTLDGD
jgi:hypothetical protein